ncbi:hypothetical protein LTR37_012449 [Vermiconidia calcicola]|uniref:Uncharacterized protein n=1 Tax=Vermiconidia calcicola TaxID=1690605 RepID=A0ACC3MZ91_9PEZI|nr:hypothetical protein LTR37_012449 [Vermiconidia calcicola]
MGARGKEFVSLVQPTEKKPRAADNSYSDITLLKDNFLLSTWLCFGAVGQGILFLVVGRLALVPAVALLLYRSLDAYAQAIGWKHNPYMDGILMKKHSVVFPDEVGKFGSKASNKDVVVLLIGARCNHPLGIFGPNFKELGDYFDGMIKDLETHEEFDFLGSTAWVNHSDRATNNELLTVCYFRTVEGLHAFAHSKYHRGGWDWWNKEYNNMPHLSIYHETYHAPAGNWESIYVNSHISGINRTSHKVLDDEGREMYIHPIVDASKGVLKTSAGRMDRSQGLEHEKYGADPYQNQL